MPCGFSLSGAEERRGEEQTSDEDEGWRGNSVPPFDTIKLSKTFSLCLSYTAIILVEIWIFFGFSFSGRYMSVSVRM